MISGHLLNPTDQDLTISRAVLRMKVPIETRIFVSQLQIDSAITVLAVSARLHKSMEVRWQKLVSTHPHPEKSTELLEVLVKNMFDALEKSPEDGVIRDHWLSFLYHLGLAVAEKIFRTIGGDSRRKTFLSDIQSICLSVIGSPHLFFGGFNPQHLDGRNLLATLQAYGYQKIKYSAYPAIRKEFADPNIGRSNLSLFNHYSAKIVREALELTGMERTRYNSYLALCSCAREYLQQTNKKVNQLQSQDFQHIGQLYQAITGDLSPPVREQLESIGEAIRKFTSPQAISTAQQLGRTHENVRTVEDSLPASNLQPFENLESQEREKHREALVEFCDQWLASNTTQQDQNLLFLRYRFELKQKWIEPIIDIHQTTIAKKLRKIHKDLADALILTHESERKIAAVDLIKPIIELLQEKFIDLQISQAREKYMSKLELLIQVYCQRAPEFAEPGVLSSIQEIFNHMEN